MNLVELAQRLKTLRLEKRLTLEEVADRTGLTRSWLSKVENFRVTPSLPALGQISRALGIPIDELVRGLDERPEMVVVRQNERKRIERDHNTQTTYDSLAYKRVNRRMDPFILTVPPGDVDRDALPHEGEEFLLVLSGQVDFEYNGELYRLENGDSLYFDANVKHRLRNGYKKPAQVLCVFLESNDLSDGSSTGTKKFGRKKAPAKE
jgi:transcriptional regulator with XRE-family HTH domain